MKIDEIEAEVFCIILEYVCDSSPYTAKALTLVSKYFHDTIQAISNRYHKFTLFGTVQRSLDSQKKLQEPIVLQNLRHLTVDRRGPWGEAWDYPNSTNSYDQFLESFEPFNAYLRSIKNLKTLDWNAGPIPETLFTVLETSHPRASLRVLNFGRFDPKEADLDRSEAALSQCGALKQFRFSGEVALWQRINDDEDDDQVIERLKSNPPWGTLVAEYNLNIFLKIISRASNLEYAGFVAPFERSDASSSTRSSQMKPKSDTIRSVTLDDRNLTMSKAMLIDLDKYIDLGHVNTLKFSRGNFQSDFFPGLLNFFPKLQHISMNFRALFLTDEQSRMDLAVSAKQFFLLCPPLQTISVWSWAEVIDLEGILSRHGSKLRRLDLHERRHSNFSNRRATGVRPRIFSLADLRAIRQNCPNLVDLTVDLVAEELGKLSNQLAELQEKLDEIAMWGPSLQILRLYYDELDRHEDDLAVEEFVKSIWKQTYGTQTTGERRLEIKFGEWEGDPLRTSQPVGRRSYSVLPHERDDMVGECRISCFKKQRSWR